MGRRRKQIYLDERLDQLLSKLAMSTHRSGSSIIRDALGAYFAQEVAKARTH